MEDTPRFPEVHLTAGVREALEAQPIRDHPFCIAVLGDFTGSHQTDPDPGRPWKPVRVTPDNMPELAGFTPSIDLHPIAGSRPQIRLQLRRLEDFHPDSLFRSQALFSELREAREAVREGRASAFAAPPGATRDEPAGDEPEGDEPGGGRPDERTDESARGPERPEPFGAGLLDAILQESGAARRAPGPARPDRELQELVRQIVRPHLVKAAPDRSGELSAIDRAAGSLMRAVLHDEAFQALESLWRSVVFLLSRANSAGKVRVYLVDVGHDELVNDLTRSADLARTRLHTLLGSPDLGPAADRWALVVGAYTFGIGLDPSEAQVLEQLGRVARAADVPWISGGDPRLAGCTSLDTTPDPRDWSSPWEAEWSGLPDAAGSAWLGLATPRFLAREPYGSETGRRCTEFEFEEQAAEGEDRDVRTLLWGNPAFVCAALLAQGFAMSDWGFSPDALLDLGAVPSASGSAADPAPVITEHRLTREAAGRVAESGLMPLISFPYEARIRLGGFRPISRRSERLRAWWNA